MKYAFIAAHRNEFRVRVMCRVLNVSSSGYHEWARRTQSKRGAENARLLVKVKEAFKASGETYGSRRVCHKLRQDGEICSRGRIARLMSADGLQPRTKRRFVATTDSKHNLPVAENVLDRDAAPSAQLPS